MPLLNNATITTTRRGGSPLQGVRVYIKPPTKIPVFNAAGYLVQTTILLDPDADIRKGDAIRIDAIDGFASLDRQEGYTAQDVIRVGNTFGLGTTQVIVEGIIQ